jgi:hypothetical protein
MNNGRSRMNSNQQPAVLLIDHTSYRLTKAGTITLCAWTLLTTVTAAGAATGRILGAVGFMLMVIPVWIVVTEPKADIWVRERIRRPATPEDKKASARLFRSLSRWQSARRWIRYSLQVATVAALLIWFSTTRMDKFSGQLSFGLGTNIAVVAAALLINGCYAYRRRLNDLHRGALLVMKRIIRDEPVDPLTVQAALIDLRRGFVHDDAKFEDGIIDQDFALVASNLLVLGHPVSILAPLADDVLRKMDMHQKSDSNWFSAKTERLERAMEQQSEARPQPTLARTGASVGCPRSGRGCQEDGPGT